uniref:Uncharacterized protein n=1 Tax=Aegilops tauschii subsp. strangulata TaxID=200361 RepID=A0A452Y9M8_AEGTS
MATTMLSLERIRNDELKSGDFLHCEVSSCVFLGVIVLYCIILDEFGLLTSICRNSTLASTRN